MRYIILTIIAISLFIVLINTNIMYELSNFKGPYKENASPLFFLDLNSSFYYAYSLTEEPNLALRKLGHFIAYGTLAAIIFIFAPIKKQWLRGGIAIGFSTFIGLLDEVHQYFLIDRSGLLLDVLINAAGSTLFVSLLIVGYRLIHFPSANRKSDKSI